VPESGWLARQIDRVREESAKLPSWMQYLPKEAQPPPASKSKPPVKSTGSEARKRG